jgi:peptidylprolyl isomerase
MVQSGQTVSVHYVGTFDDGTQFDSSYDRGAPLEVEVGVGRVIPGFDQALLGMSVGEMKSISIESADAYGPVQEEAFQTVPRSAFPPGMELQEGIQVQGQGPAGPVVATVVAADESEVQLNMNHPLAGKNLNFKIELVNVL